MLMTLTDYFSLDSQMTIIHTNTVKFE